MRTHPGIAREARALELQGDREERDAARRVQLEEADTASRQAKDALAHPAIKAALARVEADYLAAFRNSVPADTDAREAAYHGLTALSKLKADLEGAAASASLTKRNLGLT